MVGENKEGNVPGITVTARNSNRKRMAVKVIPGPFSLPTLTCYLRDLFSNRQPRLHRSLIAGNSGATAERMIFWLLRQGFLSGLSAVYLLPVVF